MKAAFAFILIFGVYVNVVAGPAIQHWTTARGTEMLLPMSSLVMPSAFSTLSSMGSPWVSQPPLRSTRLPLRVW